MAKCYLAHVAYNGLAYKGWQKQPDHLTIQEVLETTLRKLIPQGRQGVFAASRTDTGVHALGQAVKIEIGRIWAPEALMRELNNLLPQDIRITQIQRINPSFKISHLVLDKNYYYFVSPKESALPFVTTIEGLDNIDLDKFTSIFIGEHNFKNFQNKSNAGGGFKRSILDFSYYSVNSLFDLNIDQNIIVFNIRGSGFLKQMVRMIMGSLIDHGHSKVSLSEIQDSLACLNHYIPTIAPSCSLFLNSITYPQNDQFPERNVVDQSAWKNEFSDFSLWK